MNATRTPRSQQSSAAISPSQIRAARGLLHWPLEKLAERSGMGLRTLIRLENGEGEPRESTVEAVRKALERGGAVFLDRDNGGAGVRLKKGRK